MQTKISFLWKRCKYRVKAFNRMNYDINWGHTYEEEEIARKKDQKWNQKLRKYQLEAWAFFGLFVIELNLLFENHVRDESKLDFELSEPHQIYWRGKERPIRRVKKMIAFMRHGFCHPEEDGTLRLDPYVSNKLKRRPEDQDKSFHRVHFLRDDSNDEYYVQIGGGKLYFSEISRAIRIMNKTLKKLHLESK